MLFGKERWLVAEGNADRFGNEYEQVVPVRDMPRERTCIGTVRLQRRRSMP